MTSSALLRAATLAALCTLAVVARVSAGTTGVLSGRVVDALTRAPLAGVHVEAVAPSGRAQTYTDNAGSFAFLSLAPDTYTVSATHQGYEPWTQPGVSVLADQTQTLVVALPKRLIEIGRVSGRPVTSLVRPGTTSDVYSIDPATAHVAAPLTGPGGVDQAYSSLATVPGVYVPQSQQGWYQPIFIRGGDQDQIGYEFDGVPVNRSYDNAPMTILSNVGQQELQVYTGGAPASSDGQGISGYINQVVKNGTSPPFRTLTLGIGGPAFYHKAEFETGGASPRGTFSYYIALAGIDQGYRYINDQNGAGTPGYNFPLTFPFTNGVVWAPNERPIVGPGNVFAAAQTRDRESIINLHVGVPHRHDDGKDDLQLLYATSELWTDQYSSINDIGGLAVATAANFGPVNYPDTLVYSGRIFAPVDSKAVAPYYFPATPKQRPLFAPFPPNARGVADNGVGIVKLQYQRNFSSRAYLRAYAYSLYSNWFINAAPPVPFSLEYILPDHTFGGNVSYANQLSQRHLLEVSGSYTTNVESRYNPTGSFPQFGPGPISSFIDARGNCYDATTGYFASCFDSALQGKIDTSRGSSTYATVVEPGGTVPSNSPAARNGARWIVTNSGILGAQNNVDPVYTAVAMTNEWRPNDRLTVTAGARIENYLERLGDTSSGYPARAFWFAAYNREYCFGQGAGLVQRAFLAPSTSDALTACPAGTVPVKLSERSMPSYSNTVFQPRLSAAYTIDPYRVVRGSYGVYARPPDVNWVQYNTNQQDLASYLGAHFLQFGYTTPVHVLRPDRSYNADVSFEQQLRGTAVTFKVTPYYRRTADQFQNLVINPLGGYESGFNIGTQTSYGVEFQLSSGDFNRDGFSGLLSYAYTHSRVRYADFATGQNTIDIINGYIQRYNSYTSACRSGNPVLCGAYGSANAKPVVMGTGPISSSSSSSDTVPVSNPYYNAAPQPLFDRNAEYTTYDILPGPFVGGNGYEVPTNLTVVMGYKHDRVSLVPSATFTSGASYGSPLVWPGYDPLQCGATLPKTPRVADTNTCRFDNRGPIMLPDPYTGHFDTLGEFRQPSRLTVNMQVGYDLSARARATLVMTGLVDQCYQRGYPWEHPQLCTYSTPPLGIAPVGNLGNTSAFFRYPYTVLNGNNNTTYVGTTIPFQAYLNVQFSL
ncbi:MAG: carboxypeptidase regulatory-like domain-containing protein [Candidatus Eremiobacteraeota bacterium]|nr:carboxypeptidase regulatory-like domain-containing protein [Candidatus Eremiobacteraeota bacterium]